MNGASTPGVRKRSEVDPSEAFLADVTGPVIDDQHLVASALCDGLEDLGYAMTDRNDSPDR